MKPNLEIFLLLYKSVDIKSKCRFQKWKVNKELKLRVALYSSNNASAWPRPF